MPRISLASGAYQSRSVIASAQRCLNLVVEPMPQNQGEGAPAAHYPTPGLRLLGTLPQGPVRAIKQATTGGIYAVAGDGVYLIDPTAWTGTLLGKITAMRPYPVSMQDNGETLVIVDGTTNGWTVDLASNTFGQIANVPSSTSATLTSAAFSSSAQTALLSTLRGISNGGFSITIDDTGFNLSPIDFTSVADLSGAASLIDAKLSASSAGSCNWDPTSGVFNILSAVSGSGGSIGYAGAPASGTDISGTLQLTAATGAAITSGLDPLAFYGADRVDYLDTYLLFNKPQTPQFYTSDSNAVTFDSLYFANKQSFSDLLVTLAVAKREIWLLGDRTTEVWYDAGASDFPFQQLQGVFVDQGCAAKYSVAVYDDAVYWLSNTRAGHGIVISGAGYLYTRISTFAIEAELATYDRIDDAIGIVYSLGGHVFYVLTFPHADRTWVYDITTKQWHEWLWLDSNGREHRHRANCGYNCNGRVVVGDWENGNLYEVDPEAFTDNGQPIKRQRSFPHITQDFNRVFYRQFMADLETGNPLPGQTSTTTTVQVLTWPPEIAQLVGPTTNLFAYVTPDWQRNVVYFVDTSGYSKWSLQLATQTAPLATLVTSPQPNILGVDPLSGDLIVQPGVASGSPVLKLNPNTFATVATFGIPQSPFVNWPTSIGICDGVACIVCNGVSYAVLKEDVLSGNVGVIRIDTMQQAGFYQNVVSGSTDSRAYICAGAAGGSTATAYLIWSTGNTYPSVRLYSITITAGAETYNPSSWPTTNPHIAWATVGTIAASAIDPTWSTFGVNSFGYDLADGNVLVWATTTNSVAQQNYVAKLNASNGAVMWTVAVSNTTRMALQQSRINGSLWVFDTSVSQQIDTLTGTVTTQVFRGTDNSSPGYPMTDSEQALALFFGNYTSGTNTPIAVAGTSNFTNGWALMGGATMQTVATMPTTTVAGSQIFLDWSDDRGHSFGNPIGHTIGATGAYLTAIQYQRLGMARDRVFRLTWSVPVATALQGAWVEIAGVAKS